MDINIISDISSFLYAMLSGLIIGLLYDFYRALRYFTKPKKIWSNIEDFLFWVIIGFVFFIVLVKLTDGVLRGFIFIGAFLGGVIYYLLLSRYIYSLIILIFKLILEMFSEIIKILIYPFKNIFAFSKKKIRKIYLIPKAVIKEMGRYSRIISRKK